MPDAPAASPAPASAAPAQQAATTTTAGNAPAEPNAATATSTQTNTEPATNTAAGGETKPATTPAETKPQETKTEPAKAYELKLPKDAAIDGAIATELAALAQKAGISQEQAQSVADFMNAKAAAMFDQMRQAQEDQVQAWDEALKADKEIGGEKIQANLEQGRRALERFADKEAIEYLRQTGLNSNPMLARIFVRIGKAMGEDRIASGKVGGEANDMRGIYKSMPNP